MASFFVGLGLYLRQFPIINIDVLASDLNELLLADDGSYLETY